MKVSIGQAAKELGVSRETLRRWEAAGKIEVDRTPNGHRRYDLSKLYGLVPRPPAGGRPTLAYARVSSHDQKEDLIRQAALLGGDSPSRIMHVSCIMTRISTRH